MLGGNLTPFARFLRLGSVLLLVLLANGRHALGQGLGGAQNSCPTPSCGATFCDLASCSLSLKNSSAPGGSGAIASAGDLMREWLPDLVLTSAAGVGALRLTDIQAFSGNCSVVSKLQSWACSFKSSARWPPVGVEVSEKPPLLPSPVPRAPHVHAWSCLSPIPCVSIPYPHFL